MHARTAFSFFPVVLLSSLVFATSALAQQPLTSQAAEAAIRRMPADREDYVRWQTDCDHAQCTLSTDVLRGASGNPPDRTDHDEYITLSINLPLKSTRASAILFHLPPWAQKNQGFFLAFVTNPPSDLAAPPALDPDGAIPITFASCDDESCLAQLPDGLIASSGRTVDLLEKLLRSDHLIVLFTSDGAPYRTSIALGSFHKAWEQYQKEQR